MRTRLIIDENTVYEIDEDCFEHLNSKKTENNIRKDGGINKKGFEGNVSRSDKHRQ